MTERKRDHIDVSMLNPVVKGRRITVFRPVVSPLRGVNTVDPRSELDRVRDLEVPIMREEVIIERHAVSCRPTDWPPTGQSETISMPVSQDQVTVDKHAVVYEEIDVGVSKQAVRRQDDDTKN